MLNSWRSGPESLETRRDLEISLEGSDGHEMGPFKLPQICFAVVMTVFAGVVTLSMISLGTTLIISDISSGKIR